MAWRRFALVMTIGWATSAATIAGCEPEVIEEIIQRHHRSGGGGMVDAGAPADGGSERLPCGGNIANPPKCPPGLECVPDPASGNIPFGDVGGICVKPQPPVQHCGGIAAIPCPGNGSCVDDPNDGCDPNKGGADCGGICSCIQNVACVKDAVFESSPQVCACVPKTPPPPVCGPVCQIFCQYGHVLDSKGCPTCSCNPKPTACPPEKCPAPGPKSATLMCGDGTTAGPECVIGAAGACGWIVTSCPASTK